MVATTGASGAIYAQRLVNALAPAVGRIYFCASLSGEAVARHELARTVTPGEISLVDLVSGVVAPDFRDKIRVFKHDDLFAPVASGSSAPTDMIVIPCSMGTLGRIAGGISSTLIERSADVMLKQRRRLVLCPRETPLSLIHLRNMTTVTEAGAIVVPPMPAFYQNPTTIGDMVDFVVGRILEVLEIPHELYRPWNGRMA